MSPPPEKPAKKPPPREDPEGIDLSDFDSDVHKVAGLDLNERPKAPPPLPPPRKVTPQPRAPAMALDLPEAEQSAPSPSAHRSATRPIAAPAPPPPPAVPSAPPPTISLDLPEAEASAPSDSAHRGRAARPAPAPSPEPAVLPVSPPKLEAPAETAPVVGPAPAAEPDLPSFEPEQEPAPHPEPAAPAFIEPKPMAPQPRPAPPFAPAPYPSPYAAPYPSPYAAPYPSPYAAPYGAPYPNPYGFPQVTVYGGPGYGQVGMPAYVPLAPRALPSPTVEGIARLKIAATFALGYFALAVLHRTYAGLTGVTDIPGASQGAPVGLQFLSFFLTALEGAVAALALAACSSAVLRLRESKAEPRIPAPNLARRPLLLLGVALTLPLAVGLGAWIHMSAVQSGMPTTPNMSDLALEALFHEYRVAALAVALSTLASAFLIVLGLRGSLSHLAPLLPRRALREFSTLFVLATAAYTSTLLILLFAVAEAPTRGQAVAPRPEFLALAAGPAIAALAFLRLRTYLTRLHTEAERRNSAKDGAAPPS